MKLTVEQIPPAEQEEILVRCHDTEQPWVKAVQGAAVGQVTVSGTADGKLEVAEPLETAKAERKAQRSLNALANF